MGRRAACTSRQLADSGETLGDRGPRTSSGATGLIRWYVSGQASPAAGLTSISAWSWRSSARVTCTRAWSVSRTDHIPRPASRARGILVVLRAGGAGRDVVLPRAGTQGGDGGEPRRPCPDRAGGGVPAGLHFHMWASGTCASTSPIPIARPRVHRRGRRAQPPSLRRLRPQHRASRTRLTSGGSSLPCCRRVGRTTAARQLHARAAPDLRGDRTGDHRGHRE